MVATTADLVPVPAQAPTLLTKSHLSPDELATVKRLALRHDAEIPELENYDRYYEGTQPLTYMHPEIFREVADRIKPVILFWPQMVVDSVEERLRLEGFKTGDEELDKELWRVWLANEMQVGFRQATVDALVMRRSYLCVGTNEDDAATPLVTPESPLEIYADVDPRTRKVRAALRRVSEIDPLGGVSKRYLTLYLPNETIWCTSAGGSGGWTVDNRDEHNLGRVPVVPMVNRARLRGATRTPRNNTVERLGRSDLDPVIPLSNAGSKMATDMMVAGEFVAVPLRALFGVGPEDFKDEAGNPVTAMQAIQGRLLALKPTDVKAFEFAAAQLQNFTGALDMLAKMVASMSGLPPHYLGMSSDNPASAEAIAGSESRLATRAERKQDPFGCTASYVGRLIRRFQTGKWDTTAIEPDWRNVRTPTIGAMADAAVKLNQAGIVPLKQTREGLGYTEPEIEAMELEDAQAASRSPAAALARGLADHRPADLGGDSY